MPVPSSLFVVAAVAAVVVGRLAVQPSASAFAWSSSTSSSTASSFVLTPRHRHAGHHHSLAGAASLQPLPLRSRHNHNHRLQLPIVAYLQSIGGSDGGGRENEEKDALKIQSDTNNLLFYNDFEDNVEYLPHNRAEDDNNPTSTTTSSTMPSSSTTETLSSSSATTITTVSTSSTSSSSNTSSTLFSSLIERQTQLQQSARELLHRWTVGSAKSYAAFTINELHYHSNQSDKEDLPPFDWVRRVSIGNYPFVACGSAYGSIYVANVESQQVLGVAQGVHCPSSAEDDLLDDELARCLYGEYDGGGVLAVAMYGSNLVASSGREGGVKLFKLVARKDAIRSGLKLIGEVLPNILVTCLKFDAFGRLYMGGQDGYLRMVNVNNLSSNEQFDLDAMQDVKLLSSSSSSILSLDISEELDMVATAHVNGDICIHSLSLDNDCNDARLLGVWNPFRETNTRSVAFISSGEQQQNDIGAQNNSINAATSWSIVAGGGNGELWLAQIEPSYILVAESPFVNDDEDVGATTVQQVTSTTMPVVKANSIQQIKPSHYGPVLSLATRPGGVLVSAGHDGMLRVTQIHPTPKALYGLGGYKVWLGSICIDSEGRRLISDGQDDVVVVHDFSMVEDDV